MNWHPTTNLIQTDLLTPEQLAALKAWPHGYEFYTSGMWVSCFLDWSLNDAVYRGKPAPVVTSMWFNVYSDVVDGPYYSMEVADSSASECRIGVLRIDTSDNVSTAHLEGLQNE
jgi:hypothetical protein